MARSVRRKGVSYRDIPAALCHGLLGLPDADRLTLREAVLLHIVCTADEDLMAVDVEGQIFGTKASTSRSVTRLENLGLIRRVASGQRYGKFLVPTPRARALLRQQAP
jgi:DNA-binding MarR family transcriptional regulator